MLPGPTIIIACPHCGNLAKKDTIISGNTFGATLWSDGKQVAPMLPEFPSFVFCKKCSNLFWVKDAKEVDQINDHYSENDKYKELETITFPDFLQYYLALNIIDDKKYIRIKMLYSFNDYLRNNKESQITPETQKIHEENLYELIDLFEENDINELIMKAEAYRNLGLFEKSTTLLNQINDPKLSPIKDKFLREVQKGNKKLFKLYGSYER